MSQQQMAVVSKPVTVVHDYKPDGTPGCGKDLTEYCMGSVVTTVQVTQVKQAPGGVALLRPETKLVNRQQMILLQPLKCPHCGDYMFWSEDVVPMPPASSVPS
jgi:hypothetical protein